MDEAVETALARARHFVAIGQHGRALDTLERLGSAAEDVHEAAVLRVVSLHELGRAGDATRAAEAALARFPEDALLHGLLAVVAQAAGDLPAAERFLLAALRADPENAWLLARYAELSARGGQYDKADKLLARAAQIDPSSGTLLRARWCVAYLRGDDAESRRLADALAARAPDDADALALVGMERLRAGDIGGADRALRGAARADIRAVEEDPELYAELRLASHPLMWGMRPIARFGPWVMWGVGMAIAFVFRTLGRAYPESAALELVAITFGITWVSWVVYTWVAPPLVRRLIARERRAA